MTGITRRFALTVGALASVAAAIPKAAADMVADVAKVLPPPPTAARVTAAGFFDAKEPLTIDFFAGDQLLVSTPAEAHLTEGQTLRVSCIVPTSMEVDSVVIRRDLMYCEIKEPCTLVCGNVLTADVRIT